MFFNKEEKPKEYKTYNVKLLSQEGKHLYSYKDVYIEHWSDTIYNIYEVKENELIFKLKLDKGQQTILLIEKK